MRIQLLSKLCPMAEESPHLRIGELSRRVDVEPTLLRAWEKRYGLLKPTRSQGNFRLYSLADVTRVLAMKRHLAQGVAAAEAARLALSDPEAPTPLPRPTAGVRPSLDAAAELSGYLVDLDDKAAHECLDRCFARYSLEDALAGVVLPSLRIVGDRWEAGEVSVAQEHSASSLIRARLLAIGRGWGAADGPLAMLACPAGESHDIGLICFGLMLWRDGWRISYVGPDTPVAELQRAVPIARPDLLVLSAFEASSFEQRARRARCDRDRGPARDRRPGSGSRAREGDRRAPARRRPDQRRARGLVADAALRSASLGRRIVRSTRRRRHQ